MQITSAIGDELHRQTRSPKSTLLMLAGVLVIGIATDRATLHVPFGGTPLRVWLAVYVICLIGAALTIARGARHPLYLAFNWTETVMLTVGVGLLIVAGGTVHSLLWLLYFATVVHGARAALFRRFNYVVFTLAPIVTAGGFGWSGDPTAAVLSIAVGMSALYLYRLFLAATDRQDAIEQDREHLRERLANLAIVEERERIARDLHDGFGASLTAAIWQARRSAESSAASAIEGRLMACLDELGALVWTTRRSDPDLAAFWSHLRARCDDLFGDEVTIEYAVPTGGEAPLDSRTAIAAIYIIFEAIRNAVRHGGAKTIRVAASSANGQLAIEIRDDGSGFDPEATTPGHGLQHMEERARGAGGELTISSSAGATIVAVRFPPVAVTKLK